jgi:hypothetical protein
LWSDHAGGGDHFTVAVLGTKLAFETGPGGNPNTISNRDVVTGQWIHVAVTHDEDSDVQIFVDGTLDASGNHAGDTNVNSNPLIVIGANPLDSRYFQGMIDEVRAYDRVLSAGELATAMRSNLLLAWDPTPGTGGVIDILNTDPLSWSPGDAAVEHDVYVGIDRSAVIGADTSDTTGIYRGRQSATTYTLPEGLEWAQTYYWRVDEINSDGTMTTGLIWTFSVADYLIVDDFESYNDDDNLIFETWIDGYVNDTGAIVGNLDEPYTEQSIVHSGRQSLSLFYDNFISPRYSEAERHWTTQQDWTQRDVTTLRLWIRGLADNSAEPFYVGVEDGAGVTETITHGNPEVLLGETWETWDIPLSDFSSAGVNVGAIASMYIGAGSRTNPQSGLAGTAYIDDIQLRTAE